MDLTNSSVENVLVDFFESTNFKKNSKIQSLWSGYGEVARNSFTSKELVNKFGVSQFIVKHICPPKQVNHPRGWSTSVSHQRKIDSYQVETNFYKTFSERCDSYCRVPRFLGERRFIEDGRSSQLILMADLDDQGFYCRATSLTVEQTKLCLRWLAHFHAKFMHFSAGNTYDELWPIGCYWHLATRMEEWQSMPESRLKQQASAIDNLLNNCEYKTVVHGDAKVANFCFNHDFTDVAAVDFQYVGSGSGVKDLVYLIGSCLSETECENNFTQLVNEYFIDLTHALGLYQPTIDPILVVKEWQNMVNFAWADFERFLVGWAPNHKKRNQFSQRITSKALASI
ncbi:phosphotransferase [Shewanella schlegeliana]|uniref:oxidoreductase family protein n=1 Tax=Shewanella schlegeliana TaxID=190308 RepID=UPI001BC1F5C1|nr:oxidoreductase family protein [Shewanella schlegeliana]GIU38318.1 phosphotransferase [Shewanella schlegeliana]